MAAFNIKGVARVELIDSSDFSMLAEQAIRIFRGVRDAQRIMGAEPTAEAGIYQSHVPIATLRANEQGDIFCTELKR